MFNELDQNQKVWIVSIGLSVGAILLGIIGYYFGSKISVRRMRRLVKRREHAPQAEDFVMQSGEDGAMEIKLSKKAYKSLRGGPIEGLVAGNKNKMVLRIKLS